MLKLSTIKHYFEKQVNEDGSYNHGYLYARLCNYFKPYWFRSFLTLFITIPIGALDGTIALALKPYVDSMSMKSGEGLHAAAYAPFLIVGYTIVQGALTYFSTYLNGWLGGRIMNDLRRQLFLKLQMMDVSYFDKTPSGRVIQAYFQDPLAINTNILNNTKQMLTRISSSVFLMGVLVTTSLKLSIIAIGILLLVLYPSTQIRKIIKSLARQATAVSGDILSFYTETVGGIRVIYGFNLTKYRMKKFEIFQEAMFHNAVKYAQAQGWLTPSMHIIASVGIAVIIWQGTVMIQHHKLSTGGFVAFIAAMLMLYNPIKNIGSSVMTAQMSMLAAGRIFQTLDEEPAITDKPNAKTLHDIQQGINFEHVDFTYDRDGLVLEDINLKIPKGQTVALVGGSGGGKSTFASLIPRFYDVISGAICIDGVDIRDYSLESLRANIAIVTQDNFLFNGPIRENLLLGNLQATEEDLWSALSKAYLKEFVEKLPKGIDTIIGERGVMLSGGQRQRLAIARAILKNAPIVLLDEATSALDSQAEIIVQKALESLMQERTVLVIAHRLSTIRNANRIVVLERGKVVETGTHSDLLEKQGAYAALYHAQYSHIVTQDASLQELEAGEDDALIAAAV